MSINRERHEFTIDKSCIVHLIQSQAGTRGKAILEYVTNSADADATEVQIDVTSTTISIRDNGHGLRTRDEILEVFKPFGFDHSSHKRTYGKFGLGRGQLWAYASTRWTTHSFELDVDVRERGIQFYLSSDQSHVDGLTVEGTFYEPMTAVEMAHLANELERLCRYSPIPVIFNGRRLGKDPAATRWTVETDEAYISLTEGNTLAVYNQGIFVKEMYAGYTGVAGTVVTKRGHNLMLNIARNDVMVDQCQVWKRVKTLLQKLADERSGKQKAKRLTDSDRDYLARQTADPQYSANFERPIFSTTNGKHLALERLAYAGPITVADDGNRMADALMRDKAATVLSRRTLARFDVTTVRELVDVIKVRLQHSETHKWILRGLDRAAVHEDITTCDGYRMLNASKIPSKDLSKHQQLVLRALDDMRPHIVRVMNRFDGRQHHGRNIILGRGNADAYTDGRTYIAFVDEPTERAARSGLGGFYRLAQVMVHEYLHDTDDAGSHSHDHEFYQAYHDITLEHHEEIYGAAKSGFATYAKGVERMSKRVAVDVDVVDRDDRVAPTA